MKKHKITRFQEKVYSVVRRIPAGKVSTYQIIARKIGRKKAARAVGNALGKNPFIPEVPCHRVICSDFRVGGFISGEKNKVRMLEKEGIEIKAGKVVDFSEIVV